MVLARFTLTVVLRPETQSSIEGLEPSEAFQILEFYENVAGTVKQRLWTVTAWILTVCAGLLAFQFRVSESPRDDRGFEFVVIAVSLVGMALCWYLRIFIQDQARHLQGYWTRSNIVAAIHPIGGLPLLDEAVPAAKILEPGYRAGYPGFCRRLEILVAMFAMAFAASAVGLIVLAG